MKEVSNYVGNPGMFIVHVAMFYANLLRLLSDCLCKRFIHWKLFNLHIVPS